MSQSLNIRNFQKKVKDQDDNKSFKLIFEIFFLRLQLQ